MESVLQYEVYINPLSKCLRTNEFIIDNSDVTKCEECYLLNFTEVDNAKYDFVPYNL